MGCLSFSMGRILTQSKQELDCKFFIEAAINEGRQHSNKEYRNKQQHRLQTPNGADQGGSMTVQQPSPCLLHPEGIPILLLEGDQPAPHSPALNAKKKLSGSLPPFTRCAAYKQERGNATLSLLNMTIGSRNISHAGKASESKQAEVHCSLADKTGTNFKVEQKTAEHRVAGNLGSVQVTPTAFPPTLPLRELKQ